MKKETFLFEYYVYKVNKAIKNSDSKIVKPPN